MRSGIVAIVTITFSIVLAYSPATNVVSAQQQQQQQQCCFNGTCNSTICDDNSACTDDSCNSSSGECEYTDNGACDACGVVGGNNCTCFRYSDKEFADARCNETISIMPSDANVDVLPGTCGFISWIVLAPPSPSPLPESLELNNVTGTLDGVIEPNAIDGFPVDNNPLIIVIQGLMPDYNRAFNVTYEFVFEDVCSCLDYDDSNPCNGVETCDPMDGQEVPGTPLNCDDADPCTIDSCNSTLGCVNTPLECDDSNPCNGVETCSSGDGGTCVNGTAPTCDDSDPCTQNLCNTTTGCYNPPLSAIGQSCYDGANGTANVGICSAGTIQCDSGGGGNLTCDGQVLALAEEDCGADGFGNSLDDNCNGIVDEGCNGILCLDDEDCQPYRPAHTNCTFGYCNQTTSVCEYDFMPSNTSCESAHPCFAPTPAACDGQGTCVPTTSVADIVCNDQDACTEQVCSATVLDNSTTPFTYSSPACNYSARTYPDPCYACDPLSSDPPQCPSPPPPCMAYVCNATLYEEDLIENGVCIAEIDDTNLVGCDDNNVCNGVEFCMAGECMNGTTLACDDSNPCTTDLCDPSSGCYYDVVSAAGTPCDDNNNCTSDDQCNILGECVGTPNVPCEAPNECVVVVGCNVTNGECIFEYQSNGTQCSVDDNFNNSCILEAECYSGECVPTLFKQCTPSDTCYTNATCDSFSGQCVESPAASGTNCSVDLYCADSAECDGAGTCVVVAERNCSYLDTDCAVGTCNENLEECVIQSRSSLPLPCDADQSVCTVNDTCNFSQCVAGPPLDCDDSNPCTDDSCHPTLGCVNTPNTNLTCTQLETYCNTNSMCSANGTCAFEPRDCIVELGYSNNDTNLLCKNISCSDTFEQCIEEPINEGVQVIASQSCSGAGTCLSGEIVFLNPVVECSQNSTQCVRSSCNESIGACQSTILAGNTCVDNDACTIFDKCLANGTCAGTPKNCSFLDSECRSSFCDASGGGMCTFVPINEGQQCEFDNDVCTPNKTCESGQCVLVQPFGALCDDNDRCTVDFCNSTLGGCFYIGEPADVCGVCGGNITDPFECASERDDKRFQLYFITFLLFIFMALSFLICVCMPYFSSDHVPLFLNNNNTKKCDDRYPYDRRIRTAASPSESYANDNRLNL